MFALLSPLVAVVTGILMIFSPVQAPTVEEIDLARTVSQLQSQVLEQQSMLGASLPGVVSDFSTSLRSRITSSDTSMTLVKGTDRAGNAITGYRCFTIDNNKPTKEYVCGTASSTSVTGLIRGIDPQDGDLEVASLKFDHERGASVEITNYPTEAIVVRMLSGSETLPGILKYPFSSTTGFTDPAQLASKAYVDNLYNGSSTGWLPSGTDIYNGNAGNVGIGTTTPANKLTVDGSANITGNLAVSGTSTNSQLVISNTSSFAGNATFSGNLIGKTATSTDTTSDSFNLIPAGVVQMYSSSTAPSGWLLANGTAYATSSYPRLFAVIGYTYGSSSTAFRVPDMRAKSVRGYSATSTSVDSMGETGGEETHTMTLNELVQHSHTAPYGTNNSDTGAGTTIRGAGPTAANTTFTTNTTGTSTPFNVLDPYVTLNYIIKY